MLLLNLFHIQKNHNWVIFKWVTCFYSLECNCFFYAQIRFEWRKTGNIALGFSYRICLVKILQIHEGKVFLQKGRFKFFFDLFAMLYWTMKVLVMGIYPETEGNRFNPKIVAFQLSLNFFFNKCVIQRL